MKKYFEKIKAGSILSVLIVGVVVASMSMQANAHGPPEINDSQLNNIENNINQEDFENFHEEMHNLMERYNFWPNLMMGYMGMGCR